MSSPSPRFFLKLLGEHAGKESGSRGAAVRSSPQRLLEPRGGPVGKPRGGQVLPGPEAGLCGRAPRNHGAGSAHPAATPQPATKGAALCLRAVRPRAPGWSPVPG